ncbi:MAG TPA: hypothetical protein V6D03_10355 [Candidatus Caenarcaniphilales bacterium]
MPAAMKATTASTYSDQVPPVDQPLEMPLFQQQQRVSWHNSVTTPVSSMHPSAKPNHLQASPERSIRSRRRQRQAVVEALPNAPLPAWLRLLIILKRASTPLSLTLVIAVLAVYGWSAGLARSWSQAYSQLEQLQREERQLTAASETRKYQIAQQAASPTTGLVRQVPANTIFLKLEPPRKFQPPEAKPPETAPASSVPMGY